MRIAIIGCGNMGSWLACTLAQGHDVAGMDRVGNRVDGLADMVTLSNVHDLSRFEPELLINAVSLRETVSVFQSVLSYVSKDCVLCDVASVKGELPDFYAGCRHRFVSIHPMFGPTFANVASLSDESAVIIRESDPETAQLFRSIFSDLNVTVFDYSFEEHDRMMAYSLSLPFVSTMVFGACMDRDAVPGTTFRKHRDIARGLLSEDDFLLAEILFNPHTLDQLDRVTSRLEFMKHIVRGRDYEEAVSFIQGLRQNMNEGKEEN